MVSADFKEKVRQHAKWVEKNKAHLKTEASTKKTLIEPFIQKVLGYDVTDPLVVSLEHPSTVFKKKVGAIDYVILEKQKPIILIEAKHWEGKVDSDDNKVQLAEYYVHSEAKYGILTNGVEYQFYCDFDNRKMMDAEPFFRFNVEDYKDSQLETLALFQNEGFDSEKIINTATDTRMLEGIKATFIRELENPTSDFVRVMIADIHKGNKPISVIKKYRDNVRTAVNEHISELEDKARQDAVGEVDGDVFAEDGNTPTPTTIPTNKLKTIEKVMAAVKESVPSLHTKELQHWETIVGTTIAYYGIVVCKLRFDGSGNLKTIKFMTTNGSYPRKSKSTHEAGIDTDFAVFKDEFLAQIEQVKKWVKKARS